MVRDRLPLCLRDPAHAAQIEAALTPLDPLHPVGFELELGAHAMPRAVFWAASAAQMRNPALAARLCLDWPGEIPHDTNCWCETDLYHPTTARLQTQGEPPPNVFVSFNRPVRASAESLAFLPETLRERALSGIAALRACAPPGAAMGDLECTDIGWFRARDGQPLRINLALPREPGALRRLLGSSTSPCVLAAAQRWLEAPQARALSPVLALDIPRSAQLGIEFRAHQGAALAPLLYRAVDLGLARYRDCATLLSWPGIVEPDGEGARWPDALLIANLRQPPERGIAIERVLSHIKLLVDDRLQPRFKAYFGYRPLELRLDAPAAPGSGERADDGH